MVTNITPKSMKGKYAGVAADEKPLTVQNGSVYFEIDTGNYYMFDEENKQWYMQEDNGGGGGGGTMDHTKLANRDKPKQHPIEAIDGLQEALDEKANKADVYTKDEVYSKAEANQNFANALVRTVQGEVITVDDVSPLEHEVGCSIIKNEFDINKIISNSVVSVEGNGLVVARDAQRADAPNTLQDYAPGLKAGDTIIINAEATDPRIYLNDAKEFVKFNIPTVLTAEMLNSTVLWKADPPFPAKIDNIRIYKGKKDYGFSPYIPSLDAVTVSRYGKNILVNTMKTHTVSGVTFTVNDDGSVALSGTANTSLVEDIHPWYNLLKNTGERWLLTGCPSGGGARIYGLSCNYQPEGGGNRYFADYGEGTEILADSSNELTVRIAITEGVNVDGLIFKPMLRPVGTSPEYEKGVAQPYAPSPEGIVSGMKSLPGNMTILTDTPGALLDVTYNADVNKVLEKKDAEIASLADRIKALEDKATNLPTV